MSAAPNPPTEVLSYTHTDSITLPQSETERRFAIRRMDWERLKRCVEACKQEQSTDYSGWYFLCYGISGSALFSFIPLFFSTGVPSWAIPSVGALFVASAALGSILFGINKKLRQQHADRIKELQTDMSDVESGFGTP